MNATFKKLLNTCRPDKGKMPTSSKIMWLEIFFQNCYENIGYKYNYKKLI